MRNKGYEQDILEMAELIKKLEFENSNLLKDRDRLRSDLRTMIKGRDLLQREKQVYSKQMNQKYNTLEKSYHEILERIKMLEEDNFKLDKEYKLTCAELEKFKERLVRIKQRKFKQTFNQKICKN